MPFLIDSFHTILTMLQQYTNYKNMLRTYKGSDHQAEQTTETLHSKHGSAPC